MREAGACRILGWYGFRSLAGWLRGVVAVPKAIFQVSVRSLSQICVEPHADDGRAYLALSQQTSIRLEREGGKHHDSLHLPEIPQAWQTISVLEIDDADGIRAFRSVLVDGDAVAKMRAPGVVGPRIATHAFFLLGRGE
jgi:hypothetical protein